MKINEIITETWSEKYKRSINCNNPKGFSQKAHCAGRNKNESTTSSNNYLLQLERDKRANMLVLHILNKQTGKRAEVRGKMGYETNGYDPNDKLHQLLDKVGKSASVSDLMNGDVVSINPRHPDGTSAKAAADRAYNEAFDTDVEWVADLNSRNVQVFATKIDDAYIELTYKRVFPADVYISFTRGGRMSVTGEGSQNKIFGAVINHVKQWVAKNKPPRIIFSAFKPNTGPFGSQDTTRSVLYSKMIQRFAGQNGYDYDIENTGSEDTFILTRQQANIQTNESLDQPYPYSWGVQSEDEWAARARTDSGAILDIRFEYGSWDAVWDIEFTLNGRYKATAAGDQFRIFATVVKAIKEWWKSTSAEGIPVNTIRFSADKLNKQTGKTGSRERLYNRFAQQFANSIGFTIQSRDKIDATDFELINPNYNEHKVGEAVEPNFDFEWEEAERYPEFVKIGKAAWIELANKGKAVTIKSAKGINNTDAADPDSFRSLDKDKQARALAQLKSGNVEMPIVAVYPDGWKELIGGNTRLTAMLAQDGNATVWVFKVPDEVAELEENFADGKNPGRKGLSKRVGIPKGASITQLRKIAKNSTGERRRMAHWQANMKSGRKKS
jgi:hypothetical protein